MSLGIKRNLLPISIICLVCGSTLGLRINAEVTNGADIYCFMRNGGNTHEPSWQAAYQFIKNKKQGLFKTSPKQAASFIVEEVYTSIDVQRAVQELQDKIHCLVLFQ